MKLAMLTILIFAFRAFSANNEKSDLDKVLEQNQSIETRESIEIRNGISYRRVESELGVFHFKLLGRKGEISELECDQTFRQNSPDLVSASVPTFKRARAFIKVFKETCESQYGQKRFRVDWSTIKLGVALPDSSSSVLKEKEVYVNPISPGVGFSGSF